MNITDTIDADQIEVGDQIIVDGEPIEVSHILDSDDNDGIVVRGFSWDDGGSVEREMHYSERVDVWAV